MLFKPTYCFNNASEISIDFLKSKKINALILDLDNTLTTHNNPIPREDIKNWLDTMKDYDIKMMIVSNNKPHRVQPFSDVLGLPFVPNGKKPLTFGFTQAIKELGENKKNVLVIGDQIFTDVLGANLKGCRCAFVYPMEYETSFWFKVKRAIEKPLLPKKTYH